MPSGAGAPLGMFHSGILQTTPRSHRNRGLGLVELLICLSISAMLLTATGSAYYAGFSSYRENIARGQMLSSGRSCLTAIARDIRMADVHGPYDPNAGIQTSESAQFGAGTVPGYPNAGLPGTGSGSVGIQMIKTHADTVDPTASTSTPILITYWFDNTTKQLFMTRGASATPQVICTGVQSCTFYLQPVYLNYNAQTGAAPGWALQRATYTLNIANADASGNTVFSGGRNVTVTLTNAAAPRKSMNN